MSERDWHVTDCGCRVNVFVGLPPEASYTAKFHFCPLHAAGPDLLEALEETRDELRQLSEELASGRIGWKAVYYLPARIGILEAAIAKASRRRDANHVETSAPS